MATFYSSFFSSGLLAQPSPRAITPRPGSPTTPRAALSSLAPDDTTPTGPATVQDVFSSNESQTLPSISVAAPTPTTEGDSRPRLRRRRSSLAGAASPLTNMKSSVPIRQAAAQLCIELWRSRPRKCTCIQHAEAWHNWQVAQREPGHCFIEVSITDANSSSFVSAHLMHV
ncbi:hypothetical protein ONZ51_g9488 [Trametes cubensis]|uniref:Uncharacterized protein n=1 Tax=Trametes cubensis TaxID=1111947 RepID=A0AAD7TLP8_9APHY|nr:hypothetical protein ONZ51_g9488 [Trametes cubensis]